MSNISLTLEKRTAEGKKVSKLRQAGIVPSIVYGGGDKPMMTQSSLIETAKVVGCVGKHTPLDLLIDGHKKLAIIKDVDQDPVRHSLRHVAFHTINQNDIITTEVPIVLIGQGESVAERAGLVILQALEYIEVKAKPADLPESLELSIVSLETDEDKLTVADIKLPKGVEFADIDQDMDLVIANVYEPGALQAANEATGGDATEDSEVEVASAAPTVEADNAGSKSVETDNKN